MKYIINALNSSNSQVKMAVISLLGVMYLYMGHQLSLFFENEKPTLVQQLNEEFEKVIIYFCITFLYLINMVFTAS